MRRIEELDLSSKKVLIRADFNVPLNDEHEIVDDIKLREFLPTLKYVLEQGGLPVIISHLGRPAGKVNANLSLKPIAEKLAKLADCEVRFAPDCIGPEAENAISELKPGQALVLENLRFHPGEVGNDENFAKAVVAPVDIYINDAFGVAHRKNASIVSMPKFARVKAPGLLMEKELDYFEKALLNPKPPLCVVLGGSKIATKFNVLANISEKADMVIIGGALANTFLAAQGIQVGRSLYAQELFPKVIELIGKLVRRRCKVYLPVDVLVAPSAKSQGLGRAVPTLEIPAHTMALDTGPATNILFKEALQSAETILWNGPMGVFEEEDFATGTTDLIEHLAGSHGLTVAGGGDTVAAINSMELKHKFGYISTGGAPFLALLEGKDLPAISALRD